MPEARTASSIGRMVRVPELESIRFPLRLEVIERDELRQCSCWQDSFTNERKDHRYYELVEDTLHPEFVYRYFLIKDAMGEARMAQVERRDSAKMKATNDCLLQSGKRTNLAKAVSKIALRQQRVLDEDSGIKPDLKRDRDIA